jgi:hypothetical protein
MARSVGGENARSSGQLKPLGEIQQMRFLKLGAVSLVAALGVSSTALAAFDSGSGDTTGETILLVYDGNQSEIVVLGGANGGLAASSITGATLGNYSANTIANIAGSTATTNTWNINLAGFNTAATRYIVMSDSVIGANGSMELSSGTALTTANFSSADSNTAATKPLQLIANILNTAGCGSPCIAISPAANYYGTGNLGATTDVSQAINSAANFYAASWTGSGKSITYGLNQYVGTLGTAQWTLSSTGALTYQYGSGGGSSVPLPAAAWLLVSGLFGLGSVSRRRKVAA